MTQQKQFITRKDDIKVFENGQKILDFQAESDHKKTLDEIIAWELKDVDRTNYEYLVIANDQYAYGFVRYGGPLHEIFQKG